jgi:hypothetical protein
VKPLDVHRKRTVPMLFGAFCTPAHPDCILQCNIEPLTTSREPLRHSTS